MLTTGSAAWERLRGSLWDPPKAASSGARKTTYQTALAQAEELFGAARDTSPLVRPLLVFYGLSQGGRAIAAAASAVRGNDWQMSGHGIVVGDTKVPLDLVQLKTGKPGTSGSFVRLSELLGSPVWGPDILVPFVELWDALPVNSPSSQALHSDLRRRRTPLDLDPRQYGGPVPTASALVGGFPGWLANEPQRDTAFDEYFAAYPEACARVHTLQPLGSKMVLDTDGDGLVEIRWAVPGTAFSAEEREAWLRGQAKRHAGAYYFFPSVGAAGGRLHPLMSWWAVLYALSMVARYEPSPWRSHLDINNSRHAHPVEKLLDEALDVVPALIAEAIDEVG